MKTVKMYSAMCKMKGFNLVKMTVLGLVFLLPWMQLNAQSGKENFDKLCMTCHLLSSKSMVGPGLAGITDKYEESWLVDWIHDSQALVQAGDPEAVAIFEEYNQVPMPAFTQLSEAEIKDILTYIKENDATETASVGGTSTTTSSGGGAVSSYDWGVYDTLALLAMIAVAFYMFYFRRKTILKMQHNGYHEEPHKIPNYTFLFFAYAGIAYLLAKFIVIGLQGNSVVFKQMMFIALPYVSLVVFLIGSIYRYKNRGFQVSSLSTEFLEGKKLFWGSQLFHWSILILFFGHLIAFLFPSSIVAWNGSTVRLLILEFTSFAFGLTALLGVALLVKRRLSHRKLKVVANKMDMVVYTVLLTQIISGLGVAFFVRWGSSWFSSVLTPYLLSVFSFKPDIVAVSELPWLIQLHIISAFSIIGIIPFTRFVHFLVAPIDYVWRRYQLVIWNWNPKMIRNSTRWNYGKKARNH